MIPLAALVVPVIVKMMAEAAAGTVAVHVTEKAVRAFESDEDEGDEEEN